MKITMTKKQLDVLIYLVGNIMDYPDAVYDCFLGDRSDTECAKRLYKKLLRIATEESIRTKGGKLDAYDESQKANL